MFRCGEMYDRLHELQEKPWLGRMTPFRLFGNTYFIGTYQASCHLIDTGDGLIMIDPGYSDTAYLVIHSIHELGFRPQDVKYIINTHWHGDHTEATAAFAALTGAKTLLGREDVENAKRYFTPDLLVDDGDTLSLGDTTIRFLHTPGHTRGTISLFYETQEAGKICRLGMFGGAGLNTLVPKRFEFDGCRDAYFASLERLKSERVDVMLGNHTWNNDTYNKSLRLLQGGGNDFVDGALWGRFLDDYRKRLESLVQKEL